MLTSDGVPIRQAQEILCIMSVRPCGQQFYITKVHAFTLILNVLVRLRPPSWS